MDNTVTLSGNITRQPELKFTPSGQALCQAGMAVNRRWQNKQTQEWQEETSFFDLTIWGQLGQNVADSIEKGARVVVTGRLQQRTWETDEGDKRSKVDVVVDDIGPSLKWATADVTRNERTTPSGGGGSGERAPDPSEDPFD